MEPMPPTGNPTAPAPEAAPEPAAESAAPAPQPPASPAAPEPSPAPTYPTSADLDREVLQASARHTRRSFVVAAAAAAGGYGLYRWIEHAPPSEMQPAPLRNAFNFNSSVSRAVFDNRGLAPTYPLSRARDLRVNGNYGLKEEIAPENYRLQLVGTANPAAHPRYTPDVTAWNYHLTTAPQDPAHEGHDTKEAPKAMMAATPGWAGQPRRRGQEEAGPSRSTLPPGTPGLLLTLDDVTALPHLDFVTQFKCIEGWSEIVHWGGVRLRDLLAAFPPALDAQGREPRYVYMETPDGDYYCGFTLEACRHPQSLLVTHMSGQPLPAWHGAPLRLHMPIKYGYKQIKRIGLIAYMHDQPDDYWTKLGYDWHAGL